MSLIPCLIVDPKTGRVYGHINVTPAHMLKTQALYHNGVCRLVYALLHPDLRPSFPFNKVALASCLLVAPLEQPDR